MDNERWMMKRELIEYTIKDVIFDFVFLFCHV